ncbi:MAG: hypothetical protein ACKO50_01270, partial [Cyanobium sp.]
MRRLNLDTSLVVAALVHEAGTASALGFLQAHAEHSWLISTLRDRRLHTLPLAAEAFEDAAWLALTQAPPLRPL